MSLLQKVMAEFFPTLLSFAQQLTRALNDQVSVAGATLFVTLFTHFTDAYHQQVTSPSCLEQSGMCFAMPHLSP